MGRQKDFILQGDFVLTKSIDYLLIFPRQTADAKILLLISVHLNLYEVICDKTCIQKEKIFNISAAVKHSTFSVHKRHLLKVKT